MASELTPKQKRFVEEYLVDLNATAAAKRAGYSEDTARSIGSENLSKPDIQEAIIGAQNARSQRTQISADTVLKELLRLATSDLAGVYDEKGNLRPIHEIPEDARRAIAGVKVFEEFEGFGKDRVKVGEVREVKLWDKPRALELLAKHLGLITEKVDLNLTGPLADRLAKARKRAAGD